MPVTIVYANTDISSSSITDWFIHVRLQKAIPAAAKYCEYELALQSYLLSLDNQDSKRFYI